MTAKPAIKIKYIKNDFNISELHNKSWKSANQVKINSYWSGEKAPKGRIVKVCLLWSDTAFYLRFIANQNEPLVVSDMPDISKKTKGLWDRDVCEVFLAPNRNKFRKYFEFEVAPNGEWIDLEINQMPEKRETDWDYTSGVKTYAEIGEGKVSMAMKIPWKAFGKMPEKGDIWLGNLFRAVGKGETRGYLAWQPTETEVPNFHVPEKFGKLEFT